MYTESDNNCPNGERKGNPTGSHQDPKWVNSMCLRFDCNNRVCKRKCDDCFKFSNYVVKVLDSHGIPTGKTKRGK